jgi:hypothetical protein
MATNKLTYQDFAKKAIEIANRQSNLFDTDAERTAFIEKANALIATQAAKSAYNKANPKKNSAKGASDDTKAKGVQIAAVLGDSVDKAMTAAEINAILGTGYTALQVANAVKFLNGAVSCKVVRESVDKKGLKSEKLYTAYYLG